MPEKKKDKSRVKVSVVEESDIEHEDHLQGPSDNQTDHTEQEYIGHSDEHDQEEHDNDEEHEHDDVDEREAHHKHDADQNESKNPEYPVKPTVSSDRIPFWVLFFAFLIGLTLGAGLIGGIFYYRSKVGKLTIPQISTNKIQTTEEPAATVQPTPEAKIDLTKYAVQILNGSGIAGEAGRVETLLKSAGFTNTQTGNAGSYSFTTTEIATKKSVPKAVYDEITTDLDSYEVKQVADLPDNSTYDIVITVGKTKK